MSKLHLWTYVQDTCWELVSGSTGLSDGVPFTTYQVFHPDGARYNGEPTPTLICLHIPDYSHQQHRDSWLLDWNSPNRYLSASDAIRAWFAEKETYA